MDGDVPAASLSSVPAVAKPVKVGDSASGNNIIKKSFVANNLASGSGSKNENIVDSVVTNSDFIEGVSSQNNANTSFTNTDIQESIVVNSVNGKL